MYNIISYTIYDTYILVPSGTLCFCWSLLSQLSVFIIVGRCFPPTVGTQAPKHQQATQPPSLPPSQPASGSASQPATNTKPASPAQPVIGGTSQVPMQCRVLNCIRAAGQLHLDM